MANVRIDPDLHQLLKAMAQQSGESMQSVLAQALERERRRRFLERVNAAYENLSPEELSELQAEHAEWDVTLLDGLADADEGVF